MEIGKVSIIVPAYNIAPYLSKCMEGIVAQSYKHLQIIVVDDGSNDNTLEIAMTYAGKDERVTVITQSNSGVSVARNRGLEEAVGEFVMFVDGDDWLDESAVEKMLDTVKKYNLDVVRCGFIFEDTSTGKRRVSCNKKPLSLLYGKDIMSAYLRGCGGIYASVCGGLYRTSFLKKHNFRFEPGVALGEDGFFTLRVVSLANSIGVIGGLDNSYYHILVRSNSATRSDVMKREVSSSAPSFENYLRQTGLLDKFKTDCHVWTVRATSSELCKAASRLTFKQYLDFYERKTAESDFKEINIFKIRCLMTIRNHMMSFLCKNPTLSYIAIFSAKKLLGKILF